MVAIGARDPTAGDVLPAAEDVPPAWCSRVDLLPRCHLLEGWRSSSLHVVRFSAPASLPSPPMATQQQIETEIHFSNKIE
jgi:hypothetical protein